MPVPHNEVGPIFDGGSGILVKNIHRQGTVPDLDPGSAKIAMMAIPLLANVTTGTARTAANVGRDLCDRHGDAVLLPCGLSGSM